MRVPLDFSWRCGEVWKGYLNPYPGQKCTDCRGTGYSPAADRLMDLWYCGEHDDSDRLMDNLTDDDVRALVEANRLWRFTHTWSSEAGWERRADGYVPSAAEVNAWSRDPGLGHDSINAHVIVEHRCKLAGEPLTCAVCDGGGRTWETEELRKLHEDWEEQEPPTGSGWQVWETVSEGSPVTPVFATPEQLATHLSTVGDEHALRRARRGDPDRRPSYEQAWAFVNAGSALSMTMDETGVRDAYGASTRGEW